MSTSFTKMLGCRYPIIAGPMFLVSDPGLVSKVSNAGGVGVLPSLNGRTPEAFRDLIREIKCKTNAFFGVNLIVNQSNLRLKQDLQICVEEKVPWVITSLGNPKEVIERMHSIKSLVFCDVTQLMYAKKVEALGADGVIAVSSGAGGHAGPLSPFVLLPYLKKNLKIPIVAAGGIVNGQQMAAALLLGACAVQVGTRFIASQECQVGIEYKQAILDASCEDIVLTQKLSGTPVSVIQTPYIKKQGLRLNGIESFLLKYPKTKKIAKILRAYLGSRLLEKAISTPTWKQVWSAGQGVGLIEEILPCSEIVLQMVAECYETLKSPLQSHSKNE